MPARSLGKGERTASSAIVGDTECSKAPSGAAGELLSGPFVAALELKLPDTHAPVSGRVNSDQEVIRLRNVVEFRFVNPTFDRAQVAYSRISHESFVCEDLVKCWGAHVIFRVS